jgi:NAD(P)H-hydrate repair Nnr-like enzyme with NAD(P)H-hydrate dehydratase domain
MVGAHLAAGAEARRAALEAVYIHGLAADCWPAGRAMTASALARRVTGS